MGKICGDEGWISLGPWGGVYGEDWAYKAVGPIMQITIGYNIIIESILFERKCCDGVVVGSFGIGCSSIGGATRTFCIDSSVEQLSSISLTYGGEMIVSLCFETNIGNKYGPFGPGSGASSVSIPIGGGVITGFHGRYGSFLSAIGIFVAPKVNSLPNSGIKVDSLHSIQDPDFAPTQLKGKINDEGLISLGPWGGKDGLDWAYKANGPIMQISICYGEAIDSILFRCRSFDGLVIGSSEKIGGTGGHTTKTFCIDSSVEQLSFISLSYGDYYGQVAIRSLCFETNIGNKYGPFGTISGATSQSVPIEGGVTVGFYGHCGTGTYLTAIGIFVAPKVNNLPSTSGGNFDSLHSVQDPNYAPTQLEIKNMVNKDNSVHEDVNLERLEGNNSIAEGLMSLGPWGGKEGKYWAYKPDGPILHITIRYGYVIHSILFTSKSCDGGVIGSSEKFGGTGGRTTETFCIDTSEEQLTSISLTYDYFHGKVRITTLCFNTTLNKYGPFGSRLGHYSEYIPIEGRVFSGFHGRTDGRYIAAIGIFVPSKVNHVHSTQDPDSAPIQLKVLGSGVASKPKTIDTPTIKSKWSLQFSVAKFKANFCGSKPKTLENIIVHNAASSSAATDKDDHHGGAPSPSSETIRMNLDLMDSASQSLDLVDSAFQKYTIHMSKQISEAREKLEELKRLGSRESDFHKLEKAIAKLKFQIPLATNKYDLHGGALSPTSKMIHSDLILLDAAFAEAEESMHHMNVKMNQAHEKFKELQTLPSSERDFDKLQEADFDSDEIQEADSDSDEIQEPDLDSDEIQEADSDSDKLQDANSNSDKLQEADSNKLQEADSDKLQKAESDKLQKADSVKKELRKVIGKLKVQIRSHNKIRHVDSNPHHKNWDNINEAEGGMTHFFHKEPEVAHTSDFDGLLKDFHDLPEPLRCCLSCFFKFPPMATIKRTPMIYLWIGQGYISEYLHTEGYVWDVEMHAGKIFDELIAKGFIEPIYQNCSLVPDSCKMSSFVRSSLYEEAKRRGFTSNGTLDLDPASVCGNPSRHSSCLINVGEAIINFQPEIFENMKVIRSLYLGRWQSSTTHHIELANAKILRGLNKLKNLTFLSLRGISMITKLPAIISELNDLMILDLRACYNLDVIPDNIGLLKSLTHLDMSECYSLENMPKSLAELSNLQVLKGFLIGDFNNDKQSCTLRDLSGLQKLRKLNIHTSVKDLLRLQDFEYLERFEGVKKLTISWGRLQARAEVNIAEANPFRLPSRLQKLVLQCFPMTSLIDGLMPGKLKELKKLYIRGGQLRDLGEIQKRQVEQWNVEILRLEYLSELELYWKELRTVFPKLIYLHQEECPKFISFPCDERGMWIDNKAIDTHVQLQKYLRTSGMISSSSMLGSGSTSTQDDCNIVQ